eukprot:574010-Pleurochrysis_carterae.AAC.2
MARAAWACELGGRRRLHEEVAQVLLEVGLVLAVLEHAVDGAGELRLRQIGEGGREHLHEQLAHVLRVARRRARAVLQAQQRPRQKLTHARSR